MPPANSVATPAFLFSETCPRCESALRQVLPFFEDRGAQLFVRKPTVAEARVPGFGYPAVFLPAGSFGLDRPYLLVGAELLSGLEALVD